MPLKLAALILPLLAGGCVTLAASNLSKNALQPPSYAADLTARFFGSTTLLVEDTETAVLFDGFLVRPGLWHVIGGRLEPTPAQVELSLEQNDIRKATLVIVAHGHHDHALGSARVADALDAQLAAPPAVVRLARDLGYADTVVLENGKALLAGSFKITAFASPHSLSSFLKSIAEGVLSQVGQHTRYQDDSNFSFLIEHERHGNILVVPSAHSEIKLPDGVQADIVFLSVASLAHQSPKDISDYWSATVNAVCASVVVPVHWDNFLRAINEPWRTFPLWIDDISFSMKVLSELAEQFHVDIWVPQSSVAIPMTSRRPRRTDCPA